MTAHTQSKLDIQKFRKVHALVTGGATDGERKAARARAEAMAKASGLTFTQAASKLDVTKPEPVNFFAGFADWMEEKEPGYKARCAREDAERQARYAARRAEILKEFGTVKAFFDPTPLEKLILKAGAPFVTKRSSYIDVCGTRRRYAKEFAGVSGNFFLLKDVAQEAIAAVKSAYPFPETIVEAFEELKAWDKLNRDRAHFYEHHEYYFDLPIELRVELLRDVMRNQPVTSWDDLAARLHYKSYAWQQEQIDEKDFEDPEWARLFSDFRILREQAEAGHSSSVQGGRRTNADKRAAVLSLLKTNPELSDRAISRRVGVSPQTVSNWRARIAKSGRRQPAGGKAT
jgi:hypothetical protein